MKLPVTVAAFALISSPAFAACSDVTPTDPPTYVNDPPTASIIFGTFELNSPVSTLNCNLETDPVDGDPPPPPAGTVSAYGADYRGFVAPEQTATLTVTESGVTRTVVLPEGDYLGENIMLHSYVGTEDNGRIYSDITLTVPNNETNSAAVLDSVEYILLATTTEDDQDASLDAVSEARTAVIAHLGATAGLVVGSNQPLERDDQVTMFGAVGSYTVGATAHLNLGDGFTLDGGAALFDQSVGGAFSNGVLFGAKAGYLQPETGSGFRWLGSAGFSAAPGSTMSFSRAYMNTVPDYGGMVSIEGTGTGSLFGAFVEGGVLVAPAPDHELLFTASLTRNWLMLDGYSEEQTDTNPFALSLDDSTSTYDTIKARAAWTATLTPQLDLTVHGAIGQVFAHDDLEGDVALVGSVSAGAVDETFAEYGARLGWNITDSTQVGAFVLGSTGSVTGTHFQVGTQASLKF